MDTKTKEIKPFCDVEIPSDWEEKSLGEVVLEMKSGLSRELSIEDIGVPVIRSNNLLENEVDFTEIKYWYLKDNQGANVESFFLRDGDILVNFINSISQIGKCAYFINYVNRPVIFTTNILGIRFDLMQLDPKYFLYCSLQNSYHKFIASITKPAINQASFTTKDYKMFKLLLPPLPEQRAISKLLNNWDEAIRKTQALIAQKELHKKWLMQNLLKGKKRLKGFEGEWMEVKMSDVFEEITTANDGKDIHSVMTISSKLGLVSQEEKFDRVIAGDSLKKYALIRKFDFAYNKGNSKTYPMGCIFQLEEKETALVPFVYICFRPTKIVNSKFYKHWFFGHGLDRQLKKVITSGARGDGLLNVNTEDFFNLIIPFPSKEEQTAIAQILQAADTEIQLLKTKVEKLKEQKKGLMQVLLSGKKRLKIV